MEEHQCKKIWEYMPRFTLTFKKLQEFGVTGV